MAESEAVAESVAESESVAVAESESVAVAVERIGDSKHIFVQSRRLLGPFFGAREVQGGREQVFFYLKTR